MDSRIETQQHGESPLDPARTRLVALSAERGVSLSALSGLLGRNAAYIQQYIRRGSPRQLDEQDRSVLARFFGGHCRNGRSADHRSVGQD